MFRSISLTLFDLLCLSANAEASEMRTGHPMPETALKVWNIDVRHGGAGLPPGQGTAEAGEEIYSEKCAACHGDFGEGVGRAPPLFGGTGTLATEVPRRLVGNFWPHAPILFDYMRRSMPFGNAQSLGNDELYALTAFILNMNDLWDDDQALTAESLASIKIPNRGGFVDDRRPDITNKRHMKDCRSAAPVTSRAVLFGNPEN